MQRNVNIYYSDKCRCILCRYNVAAHILFSNFSAPLWNTETSRLCIGDMLLSILLLPWIILRSVDHSAKLHVCTYTNFLGIL